MATRTSLDRYDTGQRPRRSRRSDDPDKGKTHRWRDLPRGVKALVITGCVLLTISLGGLALFYGLSSRYNNKAGHEAILDDDIRNPIWNSDGPLNFLMLGTDSRNGADTQSADGGANSDTIMLLHISKGLQKAFIVSIPRDSWVDIPASGSWPGGKDKINSAFARGGAALTAKTLYNLTNIKLDGAVIVNFSGIQKMVDAVGGVHVCPPYSVPNHHTRDYPQFKGWNKGQCYDMSGLEAEVFVRQRYDVPGGDFGRMKDQQLVIKALADKATSAGILTNPVKLDRLLVTVAESLTLDKSMPNLRDVAFALKGIRPDDLKFASLPHNGTAQVNGVSTVQLNPEKDQELFQAILDDKTDEWLAAHPQKDIPDYGATG